MADALARPLHRTGPRPAFSWAPAAPVWLAAASLAAMALAGCSHLPSGPFPQPSADVTSPIADDIRKVNAPDAPYPSFLSVPNRPQDVRPTTAWTRNIYDTIRLRRQMRAMAVMNPQELYGAEAFAKQARQEAATPVTPAEAAAQTDKSNRFAKDLRDRAKAPSPVN